MKDLVFESLFNSSDQVQQKVSKALNRTLLLVLGNFCVLYMYFEITERKYQST